MGEVWLARDDAGIDAALKVLSAPDPRAVNALRREIRTLAGLDHPSIVSVLDHGVRDGLPWYAMQLVEGPPFSQRLGGGTGPVTEPATWTDLTFAFDASEPSGAPPTLEMPSDGVLPGDVRGALGTLARVCRALAWLHGEGLVHCDLKPDNVLVTSDGPVLIDFGLAAPVGGRLDAYALESAGVAAGTVGYLSPERIAGGSFDARTDLYAVGCMLYEVLTGGLPFVGSTTDVLRHHLFTPPVEPSRRGNVPPALDALVVALLAKQPRQRPGHALAIVEVLASLGIDVGDDDDVGATLFTAPLVSRSDVLEQARTALRSEGVAVLFGESGVGKTRLAAELVGEARQRRAEIITGAGVLDASPLSAWTRLLEQAADLVASGAASLGDHAAVLAPYSPAIAALPGLGPAPPELPPAAARLRIFRALRKVTQLVLEHRGRTELLVVLDDLQWVDPLSFSALAATVADLPDGWRVLATVQADVVPPPLEAWLRGVPVIELQRLDDDATTALVAEMLGIADVPETLGAWVAGQAAGNPFFVTEYLQLVVERGILRRDRRGAWTLAAADGLDAALPTPGAVASVVDARLDGLSDPLRGLCEAAAVLGKQFATQRLGTLVPLDGLARLLTRRILEDAGEDELRFVHGRIRLRTLDAMLPARRVALHRAAVPTSADDAEAALHWEGAEVWEEARAAWVRAGDAAARSYAHETAERAYRRALELRDSDEVACKLVANVLFLQARFDDGEALLDGRAGVDARVEQAACRVMLGRPVDLADIVDGPRGAEACYWLGVQESRHGRSSREWLLQALERGGDALFEARVHNALATDARDRGDLAGAQVAYQRSLDLALAAGHVHQAGVAYNNLGNVSLARSDYAAARGFYQQAMEAHTASGDVRVEGIVGLNLGIVARATGDLGAAVVVMERAIARLSEVGDPRAVGLATRNLAQTWVRAGRYARGVALAEEAVALLGEVGDRRALAAAWRVLASGLAELGRDPSSAWAEAEGLARETGNRGEIALSLVGRGRHERDVALFTEARELAVALDAPGLVATVDLWWGVTLDEPARLEAALPALESWERAVALATLGRRDEARAILATITELGPASAPMRALE